MKNCNFGWLPFLTNIFHLGDCQIQFPGEAESRLTIMRSKAAIHYFIFGAILHLPKMVCLEYKTFNRSSTGKERRVQEEKSTEEEGRMEGRTTVGKHT